MPSLREFATDAPCLFLHCYAGSNRSAALAIALAVERTNRSLDDVISEARQSTTRAILDNTGFVRQLVEKYGPHH
jgi:protein-tyrosine phosphatase